MSPSSDASPPRNDDQSTHIESLHEGASGPVAKYGVFHPNNAVQRKAYFKVFLGGCFALIIAILTFFSLFWGALWKTPVRNLDGWVIDFDGGLVGNTISQALTSPQVTQHGKMTWTIHPASQFPNGPSDVAISVREQHGWAAITINSGATQRLQASLQSPNASYQGSEAITLYAAEARNENAYRVLIRPSAETALRQIAQDFATRTASSLVDSTTTNTNLTRLLRESPQTLTAPIGYTIVNVAPFDIPVASGLTFVGLIFQLILSFFVVMINASARTESGFDHTLLPFRSIVGLRLGTTFIAYFVLSLFYALHSRAFQVDFSRKFGPGGFVIFWMLNWVGMLAVGLALESLYTLLQTPFIPFFLLLWIISNLAVTILPIEILPSIYRYGYVAPFYNISHAVRCILFGTKNTLGVNFAVLIVWIVISCLTLTAFQWLVSRSETRRRNRSQNKDQDETKSQSRSRDRSRSRSPGKAM